jgi:hypothetical protein
MKNSQLAVSPSLKNIPEDRYSHLYGFILGIFGYSVLATRCNTQLFIFTIQSIFEFYLAINVC